MSAAVMVDAAAAEQFLDANPQFAKRYYDINFRPKVVSDLLDSNRRTAVDTSEFHELTTVDESEILFDLVRDIQDNLQMEKSVFNLMRHISFMTRADRMSLFMYRQRNGVAELATRLRLERDLASTQGCDWEENSFTETRQSVVDGFFGPKLLVHQRLIGLNHRPYTPAQSLPSDTSRHLTV